ncbi:hypothetical protein LY78DRAFT_39734 [Colletotrichum sublineola]|nr:hypothetical protein LY78DRAFT_39734 [Colletotrichum sublineola]
MLSHSCFHATPVPVSRWMGETNTDRIPRASPPPPTQLQPPFSPSSSLRILGKKKKKKGGQRKPANAVLLSPGERGGRERPRGRGPPRTFPGIFCLMCQPISNMKMDGGVVVVASASARPFSPPSRTFVDCSCDPFRPSFLRPAGRADDDDDDDNDGQPLGPCHSSVNSIGNCARCGELGAVIPDFGRKTCCLPKRTVTEGTSTISIEEMGVCQLILIFNFYYHHYYYCFLNFFIPR